MRSDHLEKASQSLALAERISVQKVSPHFYRAEHNNHDACSVECMISPVTMEYIKVIIG